MSNYVPCEVCDEAASAWLFEASKGNCTMCRLCQFGSSSEMREQLESGDLLTVEWQAEILRSLRPKRRRK